MNILSETSLLHIVYVAQGEDAAVSPEIGSFQSVHLPQTDVEIHNVISSLTVIPGVAGWCCVACAPCVPRRQLA